MPSRFLTVATAVAGVALLLCGAFASDRKTPQLEWTPAEWIEWRDAQIARILEPAVFQGESVVVRSQVAHRSAAAFCVIAPALKEFEGDPALQKEMGNFVAFVRAQGTMSSKSHALGLDVSDARYWTVARDYVALPDLLASPAFLAKVSDPRTYRDAVAMIERLNAGLQEEKKWRVLPFQARFIMSVDRTTYGRLLVFVPDQTTPAGALCDKWVTFAIATPGHKGANPASVSVVTVSKGAKEAYFMDYVRYQSAKGIELMPTAVLPDSPSKNCYDCHKSAVVPIRPEVEYDFDKDGAMVEREPTGYVALNNKIREYGALAFPNHDKTAYGPCIGPASSPRRTAIVREMAEGLGEASIARIAAAMECSKCHDAFAPLNFPEPVRTDREVRSMKRGMGVAQTFVEQGWMPPGNDLTSAERGALWKSLSKEYFDPTTREGALVDWLKAK